MSKRKTAFEDLMETAAGLPWWLALVLAGVSYLVIHHFAVSEVVTTAEVGQIGEVVTHQLLKTFAMIGQYLIPFGFVIGAVTSAIAERKRVTLYQRVAGQPAKGALNDISWHEFEALVGEWFRRQGYTVTETGGVGDGGVDLVLKRDGETYLVQCKQWKAFKVGVNIVRELLGVMAAQGAAGGYLVTSGTFTDDARRFASESNIQLINGSRLFAMMRETRIQRKEKKILEAPTAPLCPKCGSVMVMRKATKGSHAGEAFWGCPKFPKCRGVVAV